MKHLKMYEDLYDDIYRNEPKIGDYVICKWKSADDDHEANLFITNNIGQIIDTKNQYGICYYSVKYDNIPDRLKFYTFNKNDISFGMKRRDILEWTKTKKELELIIATKKFNL